MARSLALALMPLALAALANAVEAETTPEPWWELGATLQARWGVQTRDGETQMAAVRMEPELRLALPAEVDVRASVRIGGDMADELEPGAPYTRSYAPGTRPAFAGDRLEIELRELTLDARAGPARVRLGKQQIVWGQADGARILDVVNPQDRRELILDDFDESRIPVWAVDVEVPTRNWTLQLLWVPDTTHDMVLGLDEIGPPDEPYASSTPQFRPSVPPQFEGQVFPQLVLADRPGWAPSDWQLGGAVSVFVGGWEVSVNAIRQVDHTPYFDFSFVEVAFIDGALQAVIDVEPRYAKRTVVGGSFTRGFETVTVRGEVAASIDRTYTTLPNIRVVADLPETERFRAIESDDLTYLLGLDWYGLDHTVASLQFFQSVVLDHDDRMLRKQWNSFVTLGLRRDLWNERITTSVLWYNAFTPYNGLVRTNVAFEAWSGVRLFLGADVFYGSEVGLLGQFDRRDRVVLGFEAGL